MSDQTTAVTRGRATSTSSAVSQRSRRHSGQSQQERTLPVTSPLEELLPHSVISSKCSTDIVSHVILFAKFPVDAYATVLAYMKPLLQPKNGSKITGLSICQSYTTIQYLEGDIHQLNRVLRTLQNDLGQSSCPLTNVKVIGFSESIDRMFKGWEHVEIEPSKKYMSVEVQDGATTQAVAQVYTSIRSLVGEVNGEAVEEVSQNALQHALKKLSTTYANFLPSEDLVAQLCVNAQVISLQSYLGICESMTECSAVDDRSWPPSEVVDSLTWLAKVS